MMKEKLKILSFQTAMTMQNEREKYDQTKWIYVPDFYTRYRYILGTVGNNPLITIGINPSTAEPEKMDNTMKSVERIATGNGFDSFIMFNVYAQRATDPNQINKEINPMLHKENMQAFQWILENSGKKPIIWAAWGTNIVRVERAHDLRKQAENDNLMLREKLTDLYRVRRVLGDDTVDEAILRARNMEKLEEIQRKQNKRRYMRDAR